MTLERLKKRQKEEKKNFLKVGIKGEKPTTLLEFPLWHNGIGGLLGALGCRSVPHLAKWVKDPVLL